MEMVIINVIMDIKSIQWMMIIIILMMINNLINKNYIENKDILL